MALESAVYISDLNTANPASSDLVSQADDHLRMLKAVLKNTFPNVAGPVNQTHTQLNQGVIPIGGIIMWSGSVTSLPEGWKLCDGGTYARSDGGGNVTVPDLRNKFVLGCGGSTGAPTAVPTIGTTGGSDTATPTITVSNQAVALTVAQLPAHNHGITDPTHSHGVNDPGHAHQQTRFNGSTGSGGTGGGGYFTGGDPSPFNTYGSGTGIWLSAAGTGITINNTGSGATHVHNNTATSSAISTVPPYYTLAFICKI